MSLMFLDLVLYFCRFFSLAPGFGFMEILQESALCPVD